MNDSVVRTRHRFLQAGLSIPLLLLVVSIGSAQTALPDTIAGGAAPDTLFSEAAGDDSLYYEDEELPIAEEQGIISSFPIGPGDKLEVTLYESRSLNDSGKKNIVTVGDDGTIFLPLLGTISIQGLNIREATDAIRDRLKFYIPDPLLHIEFLQSQSRHITMLGAFVRQGEYPLTGPLTLTRFVAANGGILPEGDVTRFSVMREDGQRILVNLKSYYESGDISQDILVLNGDQIYLPTVEEPWLVTAGRIVQIAALVLQVVTLAVVLSTR